MIIARNHAAHRLEDLVGAPNFYPSVRTAVEAFDDRSPGKNEQNLEKIR